MAILNPGFSYNAIFGAPKRVAPPKGAALNFAVNVFDFKRRKGESDVQAALSALLAFQAQG